MRRVLIAAMTAGFLLIVTSQAEALCPTTPLDHAIRQSDSVWWGTVTAASPAPTSAPGQFQLTVKIAQLLKGPAVPSGTGTVFTSSCGFMIVPSQKAASFYVGKTELFLLTATKDGQLIRYSGLTLPQGMSQTAQRKEARRILGPPLVETVPATVAPPESHGFVLAVAGILCVLFLGLLAWALFRRSRGRRLPAA